MSISLRSALTAGVIAVSASALTFTSTVTPTPQRSAVYAGSAVASHAPVDLLAASQAMFGQRDLPGILSLSTAQVLEAAAVTPTIAPFPPLIDFADAVDALYSAVEPWVRYAVDWIAVAAWFVPWIGWILDDQITVLYNFGENLVNSAVFNTTDWLRGQGSALKNIADWIVDLGLAAWTLGLDEINNWIPLPSGLYPPDPPVADVAEGVFGDLVVGASDALARVSNGIWNIWEPIESGVDGLVGFTSDVLDAIAWVPFVPLINFQLNESWELIAKGVDAVTGFAHDMINAGNQFVFDTIDGDGLIAATINAFYNTLESIGTRGGEAIQAWIDWGTAQIDYLVDLVTPGSMADSAVGALTATARTVGDDRPVSEDDAQSAATDEMTVVEAGDVVTAGDVADGVTEDAVVEVTEDAVVEPVEVVEAVDTDDVVATEDAEDVVTTEDTEDVVTTEDTDEVVSTDSATDTTDTTEATDTTSADTESAAAPAETP